MLLNSAKLLSVNTPILSNAATSEGRLVRPTFRDSESWMEDLPAPLSGDAVEAASRALLAATVKERREVLHHHGPAARIQVVADLVARGYALRHAAPREYLRMAQVANQCAYRYLCAPPALRPAGRQLRAVALAFLANAYRILGRFTHAERCWLRRREGLGGEALPPLLRSLLCEMEASLARDRRQFDRALTLLEEARSLGQGPVPPQARGRLLLLLSKTHNDRGDMDSVLPCLFEALECLARDRVAPDLAVTALHNLVDLLSELGQITRAAYLLRRYGWMYSVLGDPIKVIHGRWLFGNLLLKLGKPAAAAESLEMVRDTFLARDLPYQAALAGLELALAYSAQHRDYQVLLLARDMYPVFTAHGIPREASMVLLEFVEAAEAFRAKAELIEGVIRRVRRLERRPTDAPEAPSPAGR